MHFTTAALLSSLVAVAVAQADVGQLPECSRSCVGASFGGCGPIDIKCICSNEALISDLSCCVANRCSPEDQQATIDFAVNLCRTYQISVPTSASCPAGSEPTSGPESSANPESSGDAAPTSAGASGNGTSGGNTTDAGSAPAGATPPAATSSGLAGRIEAGMGVGALVAGALLAL